MNAAVPRRVRPGLDAVSGGPATGWRWCHGGLRGCLRVGLLVLAVAMGLTAGPLPPAPDLAPAIALSHRAEHLKAAFRSGSPEAIQGAVQEVELLRRTYGTLDVLPLVEAMAVYARALGEQGRPALGLQVLQTVGPWAPNDPVLLGSKVILMRQQGVHGYLWSIADVAALTELRLAHPVHQWLWMLQHLAWLRLMATLLLWSWAMTMAMRYRRVFRYRWEEPLLRRRMNRHAVALLGALLVTWPVILGLDPSLVAMLWLWLLAPFLLPMEVRVTFFVLLLQLVHPALGLMEPLASGQPSPSLVTLQLRPQPLPVDRRVWAALAPGDRDFLTGWRQLQFQEWRAAEQRFQAICAQHPHLGEAWNNLGVARFQQGDVAGAQASFDQAESLLPARAEVLLNQSVVAFKQMNSQLGTDKQEAADRADPEGCARILAANHAQREQRTFATPLPDTPERIRACAADAPVPASPGGVGLPVLFNLLLPLLAVAGLSLRLRHSLSEAHPSQCVRCGDGFHTTDSPDTAVCSKCHHLFMLKDGLHSESRKRKVEEVATFQKWQRWLHRFLLICLPGQDNCFIGATYVGFMENLFFCFALGVVLATSRSVRYPGEILADPASIWLPLGLALLAVLFLRSWLKLLPRRS